jgi:SAM-dependent methyltransferase
MNDMHVLAGVGVARLGGHRFSRAFKNEIDDGDFIVSLDGVAQMATTSFTSMGNCPDSPKPILRPAPATGPGLSAVEAAALVGPSGLVLGTDISWPMLERAKRNADGLPVQLVAMDGQALACRDTSFDAVICLLGLMFFADAAAGLAEFRRVLRPGAAWRCV